MIKVEIKREEVAALDAVLKDAKTGISNGYFIGTFRLRLQKAITREKEKLKNGAKK